MVFINTAEGFKYNLRKIKPFCSGVETFGNCEIHVALENRIMNKSAILVLGTCKPFAIENKDDKNHFRIRQARHSKH